jgi:hypothetical protein
VFVMYLRSTVVHTARAEARTAHDMADAPNTTVSNDCLVVVREVADSFDLSNPGMDID